MQLREVQKAGWTCTAPSTADDHGCVFTLTLHSGDQKSADFGNFRSIGVSLDKTGPDLAHHGDTLNYAIKVTTQSEAPLTVVTVTDPKCAAAPVLTGKSGGNQDALLEKGETWTYECSLALPVAHTTGDSPFVNTAFVSAQDELGARGHLPGRPPDADPASGDRPRQAGPPRHRRRVHRRAARGLRRRPARLPRQRHQHR